MNQNIIFHYKKKKEINSINLIKEIKNGELCLNGSFTVKKKFKNKYLILRDQIGTYKLFYGNHKKNDKLVFSKNYCDLIKKCKINSIYSVPRNCVSEINSKGKIIRKKKISIEKFNSQDFYRDFKEKIYFYLNSIKKKYGKTCYVCLSGGLDSAIIAYFASKVFKNPIAVTAKFKYSNEKNILSDDMLIANKVSKKLKIKIINLFFNYEDIEKKIPKILKTSQDWRDYNVHCATLNYFIAEKLSKKKIKNPVLTGDMMNEFCSDYKAETFQKKKYYELPNIDKKILQRYLINGLDSSCREISVFNHFNIPLYQPYSMVIDLYKNILPKKINFKNFKNNCNGKLLPKKILNLVSKKKNRAQMTDKKGGILGYFLKKNYNQDKLIKIFKTKFNVTDLWMRKFIVTGQFKTK